MELRVFDKTAQPLGAIDELPSLLWHTKYFDVGTFSLLAPITDNMALCGLPVKKVWEKVREFLAKYTDELPDTDELDGDSTTGSVEEHRTQER